LTLLEGPLGRGVIKTSAVKKKHHKVTAPTRVFDTQNAMLAAFENGDLDKDVVVVVRFQGPAANGMPEIHKLSPALGILQDRGHKIALVTDGRLSGASGKFPAAIHVTPEASKGGPLSRIRDGDIITLDATTGRLDVDVDPSIFEKRASVTHAPNARLIGFGRDLFGAFRQSCLSAEEGASSFSA